MRDKCGSRLTFNLFSLVQVLHCVFIRKVNKPFKLKLHNTFVYGLYKDDNKFGKKKKYLYGT